MKKLIMIILLLSVMKVNQYFTIRIETTPIKLTTIEEIQNWSKEVKGLSISPEKFAECCIIVFWCESRLRNVENHKQQGLFQMTEKTRVSLGIPEMKDCSTKELLDYYNLFLQETKKLHLVKCPLDLHVLNAAPSRFNKDVLLKVRGGLKYIDFDKNHIISRNDLQQFQKNCCKESKFINSIYEKY